MRAGRHQIDKYELIDEIGPVMNRLLPNLLNILWCGLLLAASPVLLYRALRHGKYRHSWRERLLGELREFPCHIAAAAHRERFWFHAVSVGEVLLLETVLKELTERVPDAEIVISVTTHTGLDVAQRKFPQHTVCCFPLDFSWAVRQAIQRVQPTRIVLVELELWPNFILEASRTGIPLSLINGRLSERSFRGYSRIGFLMRPLIRSFDQLAVQNETYAERFVALGARPDRVQVTGSVKFDRVATERVNPQTQALRTFFDLTPNEPVFVAGSTVDPEEDVALDAWLAVRRRHPELRLILVPRHRERFEEVARLVESRGLALRRRTRLTGAAKSDIVVRGSSDPALSPDFVVRGSPDPALTPTEGLPATPDRPIRLVEEGDLRSMRVRGQETRAQQSVVVEAFLHDGLPPDPPPVLLLDTLGELSACWGLADFAFVGGSMANRGGQNMIEPAGYGAALCFGPDTRNFRDVVAALLKLDAAKVVYDSVELEETLLAWLADGEAAKSQGHRAQEFVLSQHGATAKTVDCLLAQAEQRDPSRRAA